MGKGSKWEIGMSWNEERAGADALTFINEMKNKFIYRVKYLFFILKKIDYFTSTCI
ncbi:hypothetical protein [Snodgrassella gandavensis]|nr:hypothetical protein [Snodgrassella gandavensis]